MSPTISPKKMGMVIIMVTVGSISLYLGVDSILSMYSNCLTMRPFSVLVGASSARDLGFSTPSWDAWASFLGAVARASKCTLPPSPSAMAFSTLGTSDVGIQASIAKAYSVVPTRRGVSAFSTTMLRCSSAAFTKAACLSLSSSSFLTASSKLALKAVSSSSALATNCCGEPLLAGAGTSVKPNCARAFWASSAWALATKTATKSPLSERNTSLWGAAALTATLGSPRTLPVRTLKDSYPLYISMSRGIPRKPFRTAFSASSSLMRLASLFLDSVALVISTSSSAMVAARSFSIWATSIRPRTSAASTPMSFSRDLSLRSLWEASEDSGRGAPSENPSSSALKSMRCAASNR